MDPAGYQNRGGEDAGAAALNLLERFEETAPKL
jgi:hypothetical protein